MQIKGRCSTTSASRLTRMLDRGLALTFKNFATLFFVCAVVTLPLHVAYSIGFQNEIGLRELHAEIEQFPPLREVKGVSKQDLDLSREVAAIVAILELALVPLGLKAARRVFDDDKEGRVTSARTAWAAAWSRGYTWNKRAPGRGIGLALVAAIVAMAVGFVCDRIGILVAEPVSPTYAFTVIGAATGVARAVAAPLFLGPVAYCCVISPDPSKKGIAPHAG